MPSNQLVLLLPRSSISSSVPVIERSPCGFCCCSSSPSSGYYFFPFSFSVASSKAESWMFSIKLLPLRYILFWDWAIYKNRESSVGDRIARSAETYRSRDALGGTNLPQLQVTRVLADRNT